MNKELKYAELTVGQVGSLPLRIPILTIGEGMPRLSLLCGVHGDETVGLLICREFVRTLTENHTLSGLVSIITSANPFAQSTRTRVSLLDYYDLNRVAQGKADGNLTERVAHALYEYLSDCSFVVDLHEFEMDTLPMAIYIPGGDATLDLRILQGINAFHPTTVWAPDVSSAAEMKYSGSLLASLVERGVPGFAIETSRAVVLSPEWLHKIANRLVEVCKVMGVVEGTASQSSATAFARNVKFSDRAGIWMPTASLMSRAQADEKVGELTGLDLVSHVDVWAPASGVLMQCRSMDMVATGTSLFSVGIESHKVSTKLRLALTQASPK